MADHKEYWSTESDQGSIRISEDVVASIAALSASETKGVFQPDERHCRLYQ